MAYGRITLDFNSIEASDVPFHRDRDPVERDVSRVSRRILFGSAQSLLPSFLDRLTPASTPSPDDPSEEVEQERLFRGGYGDHRRPHSRQEHSPSFAEVTRRSILSPPVIGAACADFVNSDNFVFPRFGQATTPSTPLRPSRPVRATPVRLSRFGSAQSLSSPSQFGSISPIRRRSWSDHPHLHFPPNARFVRTLPGNIPSTEISSLSHNGPDAFVTISSDLEDNGVMPQLPDNETLTTFNNVMTLVDPLNLHPDSQATFAEHGAWFFTLALGFNVAVPQNRHSEDHPEYVEGGRTKSGLREYVLTNDINFSRELFDGNIRLYKIGGARESGATEQYLLYIDNITDTNRLVTRETWARLNAERVASPNY